VWNLEPHHGHNCVGSTKCGAAQNNDNLLQYWKCQRKNCGPKIDHHTDTDWRIPFKQWRRVKFRSILSIMTPTCTYISYQSLFLIFQMPGKIERKASQMRTRRSALCCISANYQLRKASIRKQCSTSTTSPVRKVCTEPTLLATPSFPFNSYSRGVKTSYQRLIQT